MQLNYQMVILGYSEEYCGTEWLPYTVCFIVFTVNSSSKAWSKKSCAKKPIILSDIISTTLYYSKATFPVTGRCYSCVFSASLFLSGRLFHAPQASPFYYHLAKSHWSARESPAQPGKDINHGPALTQAAPRNEISPVLTLCMGINPLPLHFIFPSHTHTHASMTHFEVDFCLLVTVTQILLCQETSS